MLAEFGYVVGSELDPGAAEIAAERGVAKIVNASLPDEMPFARDSFQLVTLLDVLEHLDQDQASLLALAKLLRRDGHLVVTVPAFQFLWGEHDVEHHHRRRYRARQLRERLEASGLQVCWVSYYNSLLFPLVALVRLVRRVLPTRDESHGKGRELVLLPPMLNTLLEHLFAIERLWLGRLFVPLGVSLIAVARKP
jgi:SAM-dependent methyltransferase